MKKILFISTLALAFLSSCSGEKETQNSETLTTTISENAPETIAKNVDVAEFKKLVDGGEGQILDVRTPGEIAEGYIKGATQIDIFDANFKSKIVELDKEKPVYVYCKAGGRSSKAMGLMKSIGFKTVYNLNGGIGAWDNAGYEKIK